MWTTQGGKLSAKNFNQEHTNLHTQLLMWNLEVNCNASRRADHIARMRRPISASVTFVVCIFFMACPILIAKYMVWD